MAYTQPFQSYQDPSYDAQQQQWNEVDFTNLQPSFSTYNRFPQDQTYFDSSAASPGFQPPESPNFSQFLNFDGSDVGSCSVPSDGVSSEQFYATSPTSMNLSRQSTSYPLKPEQSLSPADLFSCPVFEGVSSPFGGQAACQPESTCIQPTNLGEIEDCHNPPCLSPKLELSGEPTPSRRTPSRRASNETKMTAKQVQERERKARAKRVHKTSESEDESAQARAKQAHSVVERRYRDNLNGKIMQLHRALVTSEALSRSSGVPAHDWYTGREHRGKVRKSDVMTDAMNYVHQSEVEIRHMTDEITRLTDRVRALEKLVKCEDCTLLKQMVRLQLQQQQQQQ